MAGHFVSLVTFFVQSQPPALAMPEVVANLDGDRSPDSGEALNHSPDQSPVAQPN